MDLPILYEDADIVAVNKPAGLLTHGAPPKPGEGGTGKQTQGQTAEEWFKGVYGSEVGPPSPSQSQGGPASPSQSQGGPASPERSGGGYAHRLDRDTSGVLIFAKNAAALEFLRKAFHDRTVAKTYLAIVYGVPKEKKGVIDFDIGRSRSDFRLRSAQPKAKGRLREALTRYEVISEVPGYALLRLNPETGRTHQIRVHLKAIHHPVVGDALYAAGRPPALGISRLALHAYEIDVPLPSGRRVHVIAPVPPDLASALGQFPGAKEKLASLKT